MTGRSHPMQCECEDEEGASYSVFVKFTGFHADLTSDHLVGELVANLFALDLGLPAAQPCLVRIGEEFVDTLPDDEIGAALRQALHGAPVVAFGSVQLTPVRRWEATDLVHKNQMIEAAKLYLFDTLVENSDRGLGNPNLLMSGSDFKVIDFGHSFQRCHVANDYQMARMPWQNGGIGNHFAGNLQHIMFNSCRSAEHRHIEDFKDTLGGLNDATIEDYITSVPGSWGQDTACQIIDYLLEARAHAQEFIDQVRGVLT